MVGVVSRESAGHKGILFEDQQPTQAFIPSFAPGAGRRRAVGRAAEAPGAGAGLSTDRKPERRCHFCARSLDPGTKRHGLHLPGALFKAATLENLSFDLENVSAVSAIDRWGEMRNPGRLFVSISATVLVEVLARHGSDALVALIGDLDVLPRMLVLEITEHERIADMDQGHLRHISVMEAPVACWPASSWRTATRSVTS